MSIRKILRCSAAVIVFAAVSAGALKLTVAAQGFGDTYETFTEEENGTVQYIPPDDDDEFEFFDDYHNDAEEYYYGESSLESSVFVASQPSGQSSQESSEESTESSEEESSGFANESELLDQDSVDTNELTSKDWESIQKSLKDQAVEEHQNPAAPDRQTSTSGGEDFSELKETNTQENDTWKYLAAGIALLAVGLVIVIAVIVVNYKAHKRIMAKRQAAKAAEDPLSVSLREQQSGSGQDAADKPKRPVFGAKHKAGKDQTADEPLEDDLVDALDEPSEDDLSDAGDEPSENDPADAADELSENDPADTTDKPSEDEPADTADDEV